MTIYIEKLIGSYAVDLSSLSPVDRKTVQQALASYGYTLNAYVQTTLPQFADKIRYKTDSQKAHMMADKLEEIG